jgi:hypothetical protein
MRWVIGGLGFSAGYLSHAFLRHYSHHGFLFSFLIYIGSPKYFNCA